MALVAERGLALLFISHDMPLVRRLCARVVALHAPKAAN